MFFLGTRGDRPDLPRFQRIVTNTVLSVQLWCGNELFHTVFTHHITEMSIPELRSANTFLLLLHSAAGFHGDAYRPFNIFV